MKAGWRKSRRTEIQRRRECSGFSSSSSHTQRQVLNLPPCLIKAGGVCGREHRHYTSQWKWNLSDGEMRMQSRVGKWWVWVSVTWERSQGHLTDKQTIEQRPGVSGASHTDGWGKSEAEKQETQRPLAEICLIGMERRPMGLKRAHGRKQGQRLEWAAITLYLGGREQRQSDKKITPPCSCPLWMPEPWIRSGLGVG